MRTPDKIYVAHEYSEIDVLPPGVTSTRVFNKDVEYISKDALLEWAKELHDVYLKRYKESNHTCGEHWGQMVAFQRMIDKINTM